jgi:hypothetical protein
MSTQAPSVTELVQALTVLGADLAGGAPPDEDEVIKASDVLRAALQAWEAAIDVPDDAKADALVEFIRDYRAAPRWRAAARDGLHRLADRLGGHAGAWERAIDVRAHGAEASAKSILRWRAAARDGLHRLADRLGGHAGARTAAPPGTFGRLKVTTRPVGPSSRLVRWTECGRSERPTELVDAHDVDEAASTVLVRVEETRERSMVVTLPGRWGPRTTRVPRSSVVVLPPRARERRDDSAEEAVPPTQAIGQHRRLAENPEAPPDEALLRELLEAERAPLVERLLARHRPCLARDVQALWLVPILGGSA